jgi:PKD repeat protein
MKKNLLLSLSLLFLALKNNLSAQTNLSGTINSYAKVTGIDTCQQTLTVSGTTGFTANLKILLIQMNGALMDESNNSNFGNMNNLRNVGKYEINFIDSIRGSTIYLKYKLLTDYDVNAAVQMVSYPSYTTATVQSTLTATPWNGQIGGIIAFEATTLNLNANIDASAVGFQGGLGHGFNIDCACQSPTCLNPASDYFYNSTDFRGAFKGEGITAILTNKEAGRGRQNNGGGGGNDHRAGGGGGASVGNGGNGGINAESQTFRCKGNFAGFGGTGLAVANNNNRLFGGGGGGAGHTKEINPAPTTCKGGNGGGIILIKATTLNANSKIIKANGENGLIGAGGGGGGGGGTLLLEGRIVGTLTIETKGGNGGNGENGNTDRCHGNGGGGGGGKILLKATGTTPTSTISGGLVGQSVNSTVSCNTGGAAGGVGQVVTLAATDNIASASTIVNRTIAFNLQPSSVSSCPARNVTMSAGAVGIGVTYQWEFAQAAGGFQPVTNNAPYSGAQTANLLITNVTAAMHQYRYRCIVTNCAGTSLTSTIGTLSILPAASAAFTYVISGNTVTFSNQSNQATTYIWNFGDNTSSTSINPTRTYAVQGAYDVTLSAISASNCDTHRITQRVLLNAPPRARFTARTTDTCVQATIQFNDSSSNNTTQWYWEFPGGTPSTSNQQNPIVQYFVGNAYDVTLIVSNANGRDTMLRPQYIRVRGAPRASFTMNRSGRDVTFTNTTQQGDSYNWDFGDATARVTQPNPTHTYTRAGTFVVTLTATNNCGTNIYRDTVVMLALPTAQIAANQTQGCLPMTVQFNAINSLNVNNWYWQFPGGRPRTSNIANPIIQYDTVGVWSVLLTVSNNIGTYELRDSFSIRVNDAPRPAFNVFKLSDNVIALENLTTGAQSYNWSFGDNTTSNLQNPGTHRYSGPGVYNVSLLAYNQSCGRATSKQIALNFTATEDFNQEGALQISPNPTDNLLIFNFKTPKYLGQMVQFSDINGKIVKQFELSQEMTQTLDISDFAAGMYIVKIGNSNVIGKVLKQ